MMSPKSILKQKKKEKKEYTITICRGTLATKTT